MAESPEGFAEESQDLPLVFEMSETELLEHAQSDELIEDLSPLGDEYSSEVLFEDPFAVEFPSPDPIAVDPFSDLGDSFGVEFSAATSESAPPADDVEDIFEELGETPDIQFDETPDLELGEAIDLDFDEGSEDDAPAEVVGLFDERPDLVFDSVEVANEIEEDLLDLGGMTDNVIPITDALEPAPEWDADAASFDLDTPLNEASTDWSSIIDETVEEDSLAEEHFDPNSESPADAPELLERSPRWRALAPRPELEDAKDEWAHMRPAEEPNSGGWWANRPRFLGGSKKAPEKTPEEIEALLAVAGLSYKTSCPTCGVDGDLKKEDPLARQVHLSCSECDISWQTSYDIDAEAS